jgi:hypothetical protein
MAASVGWGVTIWMRVFLTVFLGLSIFSALLCSLWADQLPQLLPGAGSFELSIREDSASSLPLGAACGGEAALTLACRGFLVSLKNVGVHTVHLSRIACGEPVVSFDMKQLGSSSGWWPISRVSRPRCTPWVYENLRLRPGETTEYRTRLVSPKRPAEFAPVSHRSYTVRARWLLWGCTENREGTDCLAPLQVLKANSWGDPTMGNVEIQTPVEVVSKEIEVNSPVLPDIGPLKLGFEISIATAAQATEVRKRSGASCVTDSGTSIECTVFHYAIRNLGERPVRNGRFACSDYSIIPEYRTDDGEWRQLRSQLQACTANVYVETPIKSGEAAEGDFILSGLAPRFDTSPLYPAGRYEIHSSFHSSACFASPDGSFCIQSPREQTVTMSNVVTINATAFTPGTSTRQ